MLFALPDELNFIGRENFVLATIENQSFRWK